MGNDPVTVDCHDASVQSTPPVMPLRGEAGRTVSRLVATVRVAGLVVILASVVAAWTVMFRSQDQVDPFYVFFNFLLPVAYLVPGVVLLLRRDWHVVGWLLCLFGLGMAFVTYSDWGDGALAGPWQVFFQDVIEGSLFWYPMLALLVVFPDGLGSLTPKQRRMGRLLLAMGGVAVVLELLAREMKAGARVVPNPLGIGFVPPRITDSPTISVVFVALLLALGGLVWRYRSAAPLARRQYRWVLSAIVFLVVSLIIGLVGSENFGEDGPWWIPILFAYLFVPISFLVAILRYRLYEIDRLVSRTVTYSLVVALLVGLYAVLVGLASQVFPMANDVAVAAATLASAAAFAPLRRRVQRWVDRRFNRTRFDAQVELEVLASGLRGITDLETVKADMQAVVGRTLQPAALSVWVRGEA